MTTQDPQQLPLKRESINCVSISGDRYTYPANSGWSEPVSGPAEPGDSIVSGSLANIGPANNFVTIPTLPGVEFTLLCYQLKFTSPYFEKVREEHFPDAPSKYVYRTTDHVSEWLANSRGD